MLSVNEAMTEIERQVQPLVVGTPLLLDAQGLCLAESIISDSDSPPFDKALMDGFAVQAADVATGTATLAVVDEITAGQVATRNLEQGQAIQIMTGAPMPDGSDAVVRVEDCQVSSTATGEAVVKIATTTVSPGHNMITQGTSMRTGEEVLSSGQQLQPQQLALLAELGRDRVPVRHRPRVGILATGDELVEIGELPGPGQIRNSNETMLAAQVRACQAESILLGIARDTPEHLAERISAGLAHDVLLLSGGVSAGRLDLVPAQLEAAGVTQVFHKVHVKPGKPVWFGIGPARDETGSRCCVFGLPGNPVSSMVCFELFVRTALRRLSGRSRSQPEGITARLATAHRAVGDRPTYFPCRYEHDEEGTVATPVSWQGSSDLRSTVDANAMILFPAGDRDFQAGDTIEVFPWASSR